MGHDSLSRVQALIKLIFRDVELKFKLLGALSRMGIFNTFTNLLAKHEELKRRIHSFRLPIHNIYAFRAIQLLYFSIPVVGGIYIMDWAAKQSEKNIGKHGEKLKKKRLDAEK